MVTGSFVPVPAVQDMRKPTNQHLESYEFRKGVRKVADWISQHNGLAWSQVYYFLVNHGLKEMPKTRFGEPLFIG